ncbi:hypothetical protein [Nocardia cyriacigeorgica]|uniref:hypothetical protein n=1 Tax=Nocardia cyriacigeorgica TaxID=135487 RepID=UPI001895E5EA|nr:hypothetical protein [Nocardia cyriacigeorgica]MBF6346299.1 hypothetical protein [Nocardia cyriacigeorgica]
MAVKLSQTARLRWIGQQADRGNQVVFDLPRPPSTSGVLGRAGGHGRNVSAVPVVARLERIVSADQGKAAPLRVAIAGGETGGHLFPADQHRCCRGSLPAILSAVS